MAMLAEVVAEAGLIMRYFGKSSAPKAATAQSSQTSSRGREVERFLTRSSHESIMGGPSLGMSAASSAFSTSVAAPTGAVRFLSMFGRKTDRVDPLIAEAFSNSNKL